MSYYFDPDDNDAQAYDDRNTEPMSDDEPHGTPPIVRRPENTHMGYSEPDPAIDDAERVAIFE
jgi:hypothetical protein